MPKVQKQVPYKVCSFKLHETCWKDLIPVKVQGVWWGPTSEDHPWGKGQMTSECLCIALYWRGWDFHLLLLYVEKGKIQWRSEALWKLWDAHAVWVAEKGDGEPQSVETAQEGLIFQAMSHINYILQGWTRACQLHIHIKNKAIPMAIIIVILSMPY